MIRFVVALRAEARPLIDRFDLAPRLEPRGSEGFRTFRGDGKELVISGVGKAAAAKATAHLNEGPPVAWLNVGIAGHRDRAPGELARAHRVTDGATGARFYPTILGVPHVDTVGVTSVDVPETEFASDDLFDMEASAFYETALAFSTSELVQCVKIVSDNASTGVSGLGADRVSELVTHNLDAIDDVVGHLEALTKMLESSHPMPDAEPFLGRWHFTTSERRRLSRILNRYRRLAAPPAADELKGAHSAAAVLRELDERVRSLALELREF